MDGNVELEGDVETLRRILENNGAAIGFFRHPDSRNLVEEAEACESLGKFDSRDQVVVRDQLEFYRDQDFDVMSPIAANYLMVRRHNDAKLERAMSLWWSQIFEFTKRDQMSLMFCLWVCDVEWLFFDDFVDPNDVSVLRIPHRKGRFVRRMGLLSRRIQGSVRS